MGSNIKGISFVFQWFINQFIVDVNVTDSLSALIGIDREVFDKRMKAVNDMNETKKKFEEIEEQLPVVAEFFQIQGV